MLIVTVGTGRAWMLWPWILKMIPRFISLLESTPIGELRKISISDLEASADSRKQLGPR